MALTKGSSQSARRSRTLGKENILLCGGLDSGQILRFAVTTESIIFTVHAYPDRNHAGGGNYSTFLLGEKMAEGIITPINNLIGQSAAE